MNWGNTIMSMPPGRYMAFGGWFAHYERPDHDEWFCNHDGEYIDEMRYALVLETDIDINPEEEPGEVLAFHNAECAYRYLTGDESQPLTVIQEEVL